MAQSIDFKNGSGKKLAPKHTFERCGLPALGSSGNLHRSGTLQNSAFERSMMKNSSQKEYYHHRDPTTMSEQSSSRVKHDALGQRVRDRFNEDPTESEYNARPGSRHLQLKKRILDNRSGQQQDQASNMSRSHTSGFTRPKTL